MKLAAFFRVWPRRPLPSVKQVQGVAFSFLCLLLLPSTEAALLSVLDNASKPKHSLVDLILGISEELVTSLRTL
jgi:hypothetical protein